jgi:hypothetical protein
MSEHVRSSNESEAKFIEEIMQALSDPLHLRIIGAHKGENPVKSMEHELGEIVMEIIKREN